MKDELECGGIIWEVRKPVRRPLGSKTDTPEAAWYVVVGKNIGSRARLPDFKPDLCHFYN